MFSGASISTGGLFLWTPDETQGPGSYVITVTVTDDGVPSLSATQRFNVVVTEHNLAPAIPIIPEQGVNEGELLSFTIAANDPDLPAQHLTFSLGANAPAGAGIDPVSGLFTWRPTEAQGPGTYFISVIVTDDGSPSLDAAQLFSVTVREVNQRPTLAAIPDQSISEGDFLQFIVSATDPDVPTQALTFTLGTDAPAGANMTAGGFFTWTPDETQGPGAYRISVSVSDDGSPSLTATQRFNVAVAERNRAPEIAPIAEQTVNEGELLSFLIPASDPDLPAQVLTFSLGAGAPPGASVDSATGLFRWTPTEAQGPATNTVSVLVSDDGTPSLNVARSFTVVIREVNSPPSITPVTNQTVRTGELLVFAVAVSDPDIPAQHLTFTLGAGAPTGASITPAGLFTWTPTVAQGPAVYSISVLVADDGSPPLQATNAVRITVTGNLPTPPRLENPAFSATTFSATVATVAGRTYFLERTLSLSSMDWRIVGQLPGTGGTITLSDLNATNGQSFYRARVE